MKQRDVPELPDGTDEVDEDPQGQGPENDEIRPRNGQEIAERERRRYRNGPRGSGKKWIPNIKHAMLSPQEYSKAQEQRCEPHRSDENPRKPATYDEDEKQVEARTARQQPRRSLPI